MDEHTVAVNRRARHEYHVEETVEAGLVLTGSEIKSIRAGRANLAEAYARIDHGEAWLIGAHGWRAAYAMLGCGCGFLTLVAALTIRLPRGGEVGPRPPSVAIGHSGAMEATLRLHRSVASVSFCSRSSMR